MPGTDREINDARFMAMSRIVLVGLVLGMLLMLTSGCSAAEDLIETLDEAIRILQIESDDWQAVVTGIQDEVPVTIRTELTNLVNNSVAFTGAETRCTADFAGKRVLNKLIEIRNHEAAKLGIDPLPHEEWIGICNVVPSTVDMALEIDRRNTIAIWGYDFDKEKIKADVLMGDGSSRSAKSYLATASPYLLTLNLSEINGANLGPTDNTILISVGNRVFSEISIIQNEVVRTLGYTEVQADNISCRAACASEGLVALSTGSSSVWGQDFYLCSWNAGNFGPRPGFNLTISGSEGCTVRYGAPGKQDQPTASSFHCACGTSMEFFELISNRGHSCKDTCEENDMQPLSPGDYSLGGPAGSPGPFYYCAAQKPDGLRPGFNLDIPYGCDAAYDRGQVPADRFKCACGK